MGRTPIIKDAAAVIGVDPSWLDSIIGFESRHNPQIQNPIAYNQGRVDQGADTPRFARGLIQFTDETAQWLGFADSLDLVTKLPDYQSQMEQAVIPYFVKYAPFPTKQSFYMTVFYPAYRSKDIDAEFPAFVQRVNPGIRTVRDYINKVDGIVTKAVTGAALLVAGIAAYFFLWR